jgi:hypothetical protein
MFYVCSDMFDAAANASETAGPDETGARERMAALRRLTDIGVRMAERLDRQSELAAIYSDTCAVPEHLHPPYARRLDEIARAFAQLCRAVALAVALEERIEADLKAGPAAAADRALKRALMAQRIDSARPAAEPKASAAPAPPADPTDPHRAPDPRPRLDRLFEGDLAELDAWLRRPEAEIIAHIRHGLGLDMDPVADPAAMPVPELAPRSKRALRRARRADPPPRGAAPNVKPAASRPLPAPGPAPP